MSAANPLTEPERLIPLSEVPKTIRDLRESWAREYTRANTLEAALERSQQATSDWQGIALANGEEAARLRVSAARDEGVAKRLIGELADEKYRNGQLVAENTRLLARIEAAQKRITALLDFIDPEETLTRSDRAELAAGPCGIDCPDCEDGRVETFDDRYSHSGGHTTRDYVVECDRCDGTGRVLR